MNDESDWRSNPSKGPERAAHHPGRLQANIVAIFFFTATDDPPLSARRGRLTRLTGAHGELALLTFCVLVLRNGFTVTGESACAAGKAQ
ncbi:Gp49 family protein [Pseudomonas gorinensis]